MLILQDEMDLGGAAQAAERVGVCLSGQMQEIRFFASWGSLVSANLSLVLSRAGWRRRILEVLMGKNRTFRWERIWVRRRLRKLISEFRPAVILVNNLDRSPGWGPHLLESCVRAAPTLWLLHDMFSLGAGSHYFQPEETPSSAGSFWKTPRLEQAIRKGRLIAVAPSRWLADLASRSGWSGGRVEHIPNPLPIPRDLPAPPTSTPRGFCLITSDFHDSRKMPAGSQRFLQAVVAAGHEVHLAGRNRPNIEGASWHGFLGKEGELATFFRQVKLNLHLSILDNLPNTLAEASIFGVPSLIRDRVGGSLELTPKEFRSWTVLPENGSEAIELVVRRIQEVVSRPEIGELFRRHVQELMDPRKIAARYERLFTDLFRNGKG